MNDDVRRGKFLARLRNDKNLKQSDLAKLIGYSNKSISKWERGECFPKDDEVPLKLSEIFDVSIEEILQGEPTDIEDNYKTNIKIIDYIIGNRKLIIFIILTLISLSFIGIFLFTKIDNKFNDKIYGKHKSKFINDSSYEDVIYNNDENIKDNDNNNYYYKDKEVTDYDKYSVLINHGFILENNSYYKKLNNDVDIYFYTFNESFKLFFNKDDNLNYIITGFIDLDNIICEKITSDNVIGEVFSNIEYKDCETKICDDYNDYAMYINYLKKIIK